MKKYLISGLVDNYRIKTNLFAISPNHAIKVFQQKYSKAEDIYLIQDMEFGLGLELYMDRLFFGFFL